jgi:hypothetical protein
MNVRTVLPNLVPAVALILSGCCSLDDMLESRGRAAAPASKRPPAKANSPAPKPADQAAAPAGAETPPVNNAPAPAAPKPLAPDRSRLNQLESEELAIRNNKNLSPAERNQQLQRIWKEQTEAISGAPSKETPPPQQKAPSPSAASPTAPAAAAPPATPPPATPPPAAHTPHTAPAAATTQKSDEPKYATRVPGKSGIIKSPYDGKLLDATGVPPGTEVKDPATGKIMLVP